MGIYYNPVRVLWGEGALDSLANLLQKELLSRRVLLLCGQSSLQQSGYQDRITKALAPFHPIVLGGVPSHPAVEDLLAFHRRLEEEAFDTIVAVGGGSVLDMAKSLKAIAAMTITTPEDLTGIIQGKAYTPAPLKMVAIPTTSGSGSEVTQWATIWDRNHRLKYSIDHPGLYADYAIVDPLMTHSLPLRSSAVSSLDALCHAVEAYWAKGSNPYSRSESLSAASLIVDHLADLWNEGARRQVRSDLSLASLKAGLAFSHTRTTACHAIAYPLTLRYGIDHGVASVMTLASLLEINRHALPQAHRLFEALRIAAPQDLQSFVASIADRAGISLRLRDYGLTEDELPGLTEACFTKGRIDNNPVALDAPQILDILRRIY